MKYTPEQLEKAMNAASAEELLALAKEENVEMTADEAANLFDLLHTEGELPDGALDDVAGGCGFEGGFETNLWKNSIYFWDHVGQNDGVIGQKYGVTFDNGNGWAIGMMTKNYTVVGLRVYVIDVTAFEGRCSYGPNQFFGSDHTLYKHAKNWNTGEILL